MRLVAATAGALAAALFAVSVMAAPSKAHISLESSSAPAGSMVSGSGDGFSKSGSDVVLHFNSADGRTLWSGAPGKKGNIGFSFAVPNQPPGDYSVVATQTEKDGSPGPSASADLQISEPIDPPSQSATSSPQQSDPSSQPTQAEQSPPAQVPDPIGNSQHPRRHAHGESGAGSSADTAAIGDPPASVAGSAGASEGPGAYAPPPTTGTSSTGSTVPQAPPAGAHRRAPRTLGRFSGSYRGPAEPASPPSNTADTTLPALTLTAAAAAMSGAVLVITLVLRRQRVAEAASWLSRSR